MLHRQLLFLLILFLWAADNNEIKPLTWIYIITYSSAPSFTLRYLEELRAHFIWIKVKIVYKLQLLSEITKMPPTMKRKCIFYPRQDFNIDRNNIVQLQILTNCNVPPRTEYCLVNRRQCYFADFDKHI